MDASSTSVCIQGTHYQARKYDGWFMLDAKNKYTRRRKKRKKNSLRRAFEEQFFLRGCVR